MRILHFSDFHLGMETYGTVDSATGLPARYADFLRSLDFLVDAAEAENVDAVIFAGDAFKTRDPTPTQQREFARRLVRMARARPVLLLVGNHDLPTATSRADALSIYDTLAVPNVTVMARIDTVRLETASGPLQVVGIPWIVRSHFLTYEDYKDLPLEEVNRLLAQTITGLVERQIDALDPSLPAVVTAHGSVMGGEFGSERSIMLGSDIPLPLGIFTDAKVQYGALGHLHRHQVLHPQPPVVYAGSMERIDFGEEHEPKGFIIADLEVGTPTTWRHVATPARVFQTIDLRLEDDEADPMATILAALEKADVADKVVRLRIDLPAHLRMVLDDAAIRRALGAASYVGGIEKIQRLSPLVRRPDLVAFEQSPLQALERYLEMKKVSAARKEKLLRLAERIAAADPEHPAAEKTA